MTYITIYALFLQQLIDLPIYSIPLTALVPNLVRLSVATPRYPVLDSTSAKATAHPDRLLA
jgi:hypothetical protein